MRKGVSEHKKNGRPLPPVPLEATGEGSPYAPVDFPNPGDVWTWKVGSKINRYGYHASRFLIAPERLRKSPYGKVWLRSKASVKNYIRSEFPGADVGRFFSLFTWDIPAEIRPVRKDVTRPSRRTLPLKEFYSGSQNFQKTKSSAKKSMQFTAAEDTTSSSMDVQSPEGPSTDNPSPNDNTDQNDKISKPEAGQSDLHPMCQDSRSLADYLVKMNQNDFQFYLNSLDDILRYPVPQATNPEPARQQTNDFAKARNELSSLLSSGFPSLVNSDKLSEITNLSSKLQFDPYLSMHEISTLNLIEKIPSAQKDFLEARRVTSAATNFFAELEDKKSCIKEHKNECHQFKAQIALLQAKETSASTAIREIDEQMVVLKSRRAVLAAVVTTNQERIAELCSKNKQVYDSVLKFVNEFQMQNSERSLWELKQMEAAKKEEEILAKFSPLEGFSFVH